MAKKKATYATYSLAIEDNNKIVILDSGRPVDNAKGTIRTIAAEVGFAIDPKWNTQSAGKKLIEFLSSSASVQAPKVETAPAPAPAPAPATIPQPETKTNLPKKDDELTEEEMKQLDDLLRRIDALEARISALEAGGNVTAAASQPKSEKLYLEKKYIIWCPKFKYTADGLMEYRRSGIKGIFEDCKERSRNLAEVLQAFISDVKTKLIDNNWDGWFYEGNLSVGVYSNVLIPQRATDFSLVIYLLSDGKMYYPGSYLGDDLNTLKPLAVAAGLDVPKGTRKDKLAAELVTKFGDGKTAVIAGRLVQLDGKVYELRSELSLKGILNRIQQDKNNIEEYLTPTVPLATSDTNSVKENLDAIDEYFSGLTIKFKPQPPAAQAENFEHVAKKVFGELGVTL